MLCKGQLGTAAECILIYGLLRAGRVGVKTYTYTYSVQNQYISTVLLFIFKLVYKCLSIASYVSSFVFSTKGTIIKNTEKDLALSLIKLTLQRGNTQKSIKCTNS